MNRYASKQYKENRKLILSTNPPCALRIKCDGARATTVDHVIPLKHKGTHVITNLIPSCKPCNSSKGSKKRVRYKAVY